METLPLKVQSLEADWKRLLYATNIAPLFWSVEKAPETDFKNCSTISSLVHGTTDRDQTAGLVKLAVELDRQLVYGNGKLELAGILSMHTDRVSREDLFKQVAADTDWEVFYPSPGQALEEGSLPVDAVILALKPGAVIWRQLLPVTIMQLNQLNNEPPRSVILIYGHLEVLDASGILIYTDKGSCGKD